MRQTAVGWLSELSATGSFSTECVERGRTSVITCEAMLDCSLAALVTESGVNMTLARSAGAVVFGPNNTRTHARTHAPHVMTQHTVQHSERPAHVFAHRMPTVESSELTCGRLMIGRLMIGSCMISSLTVGGAIAAKLT